MKKSILSLLIISGMMLMAVTACKKKEEQPQPAQQQGTMPQGPVVESPVPQGQGMPEGHGTAPVQKVELRVDVPNEVKDYWASVKFILEDKKLNKKQEVSAPIGAEFQIPDSNLVVKVGPFLPDFKMGDTITSPTNNLTNPAVGIVITENGAQVFPPSGQWGWLYQRFPAIHSFQHERFALALKEGVKK